MKREADGGTPRWPCRSGACFSGPTALASRAACCGSRDSTRCAWCDDMAGSTLQPPDPPPSGYRRGAPVARWTTSTMSSSNWAGTTGRVQRGRGSAIFWHLARAGFSPTAGCVAVTSDVFGKILPRLSRFRSFEFYSPGRGKHGLRIMNPCCVYSFNSFRESFRRFILGSSSALLWRLCHVTRITDHGWFRSSPATRMAASRSCSRWPQYPSLQCRVPSSIIRQPRATAPCCRPQRTPPRCSWQRLPRRHSHNLTRLCATFSRSTTRPRQTAPRTITVSKRAGSGPQSPQNDAVPRVFRMYPGQPTNVPISVEAEVRWGVNNIEIALALDNTGSMGSSNKMQELKRALVRRHDLLEHGSEQRRLRQDHQGRRHAPQPVHWSVSCRSM